MATYHFEAARQTGAVEKGEIDADNPRSARSQLRARGLVPISVVLQGEVQIAAAGGSRYRMRESELALVTRQLASLMNAGLQLDVALATLVQQAEDDAQRDIFQAVRADVLAGHRFAESLERHPGRGYDVDGIIGTFICIIWLPSHDHPIFTAGPQPNGAIAKLTELG